MRALLPWLLWGCVDPALDAGPFTISVDRGAGTFSVAHEVGGDVLTDVTVLSGTGSADVTMRFGSFRFDDVTRDLVRAASARPRSTRIAVQGIALRDRDGDPLADVWVTTAALPGTDALVLDVVPVRGDDRIGLSAACSADEHVLGLGAHAQDVDHVGEAFALWVSEPGVGKTDDDVLPEDWFLQGTRHSSSYPVPFLHRPTSNMGLLLDTGGRVEVDLCATDPSRFEAVAWGREPLRIVVFADPDPVGVTRQLAAWAGRPTLPPAWAFGPWNDAILGADRVREVAGTLRATGAPSSVIWTEDWRGGEQTGQGYRVSGEWHVDRTLYPDVEDLDAELEAAGFKWLAYFAPFVRSSASVWDEAVEAGATIEDAEGDVYRFTGFLFEDETLVDLSTATGRDFAAERLQAALDLGFDGWMADFGEWLPTDAHLSDGSRGLDAHNGYPADWQALHADVLAGADATFFARSGWIGAQGLAPIVWAGDQRTSFDADDGFPTVVALGLGLSASAVPVFTHDVAGYNSVGNPPTDLELFARWASLGAFSPILRTHHGAFHEENVQFDTSAESLAHWVRAAREHTRLFPYRYGLAARAADEGVPMILPVAFRYDAAWDRTDAWLLGDALLIAPVLERGATARHVDLPADVTWYDWWTGSPVTSGVFEADLDEIPVFAASGTTVPVWIDLPDTLSPDHGPGVVGPGDVDGRREVRLYGGGGAFTEADGTAYRPTGTPTGSGTGTATLTRGTVEVAGVTVEIDGPVERTYTVRVIAGPEPPG